MRLWEGRGRVEDIATSPGLIYGKPLQAHYTVTSDHIKYESLSEFEAALHAAGCPEVSYWWLQMYQSDLSRQARMSISTCISWVQAGDETQGLETASDEVTGPCDFLERSCSPPMSACASSPSTLTGSDSTRSVATRVPLREYAVTCRRFTFGIIPVLSRPAYLVLALAS